MGGGSFDEVDVAHSSSLKGVSPKCLDFFQEIRRVKLVTNPRCSSFPICKKPSLDLSKSLVNLLRVPQGLERNNTHGSNSICVVPHGLATTACSTTEFSPHFFVKPLTPKPGVEHATFAIASFRTFFEKPPGH